MEAPEVVLVVCLVLGDMATCSAGLTSIPKLNVDDAADSTSSMSSSSMDTEAITWMRLDCCDWNQEISTQYPTDQNLSSPHEESVKNDTELTNAVWLWKPMIWSWWLILQLITALVGIVGNLLVIILLFQRRKNSRATDKLIGALATADLFTSVFMLPRPTAERIPLTILGKVYCRLIFSAFFMWTSIVSSVMTLTLIPVERYIAVAYPFHFKELLSRKRILAVIALTWLIGIILNSPFFLINFLDPSRKNCILEFPSRKMQNVFGVVIFVFEFFIPTIATITLQTLTARSLHRQSRLYLGADKHLGRANPSARHIIAKKRVLQTLLLVVILFIVCWGPVQIAYLAFDLHLIPESFPGSTPQRVGLILGFCNSCANPFIYAARYPEFREAMRELFNLRRTDAPLFGDRAAKSPLPPERGANAV